MDNASCEKILPSSRTATAYTAIEDETLAVEMLWKELQPRENQGLIFFSSPDYNFSKLHLEFTKRFEGPILGCSTAGQISRAGFSNDGICAILLPSDVALHTVNIRLDKPEPGIQEAEEFVQNLADHKTNYAVAVLLIDGLSLQEEFIASRLDEVLSYVTLVGGSAGDNLQFNQTTVCSRSACGSNLAVLGFLTSNKPIIPFKFNHFDATDKLLVVTEADTATRTLNKINGMPAARAYSEALGLTVEELGASVWSCNPILVKIAGQTFVRSIQSVNKDDSLTLYCAIDEGVILSIAESTDVMSAAEDGFHQARNQLTGFELDAVIGFDCILRKLEFSETNTIQQIEKIYSENNVLGFSTYGEQYNGIHINQTFTGILLGA
ncbi:FIST N-terminal domain-containing protein [Kamptonema cortianum]|nr:FIST N-terminal domain-containing protein [Kamptonema cortianum]